MLNNKVIVIGMTYEDVCTTAKLRSTTKACEGTVIHVNAVVQRNYVIRPQHERAHFDVMFQLSNWSTSDSTVASFLNGEQLP